ncbi:vacuolar iron transporter ccc1 [Trichoderma arundinaceum]|uniref:Vacuolar iron transporter ccc1 n=1 Tax=Trichoderma arundinaceum TaxID=490622 RepID=A0A395NHI7_TRIAR|nr:vacuolar iron transporter ccc1 [Trichoderma arundinaceum]
MTKSRSPLLIRFLSDFTLGFSDGLTVPFALTAGLSSLGRTDTVIYAGLAELCAGSISMGIGGYLSAKDELPSAATEDQDGDEEELKGMLRHDGERESVDEKNREAQEMLIRRHLEPLALPGTMIADIMSALKDRPEGLHDAARQIHSPRPDFPVDESPSCGDQLAVWPIASGLSISLGYIIGGTIPLLPYFFAATVGLGLRWSIALCLVALMLFGAGKSWLLRGGDASSSWVRCLWEGLQMMILGSLAAIAAVLCISLLGASNDEMKT